MLPTLLQNCPTQRLRTDQQQGAKSAALPQALLLHHAGRCSDRQSDCSRGHDGGRQPQAGQEYDQLRQGGGGRGDPRDNWPQGVGEHADLQSVGWPKEATVHCPRIGQQSTSDVLRRTHLRTGQLHLLPAHIAAEIVGQRRPHHSVYNPSAVGASLRGAKAATVVHGISRHIDHAAIGVLGLLRLQLRWF